MTQEEKKAFANGHLTGKILVEYAAHAKVRDGKRHCEMDWKEFQRLAHYFYELGKAEQKPVEIAPNQFDGITYGMQGYSTEKPVERDLTVFEGVLDTFLFNFAHSPIEDCEPKEYIKKYSSEILKAAYKELQSELKHDLFEAKQEGRKEGYEVGVYETEQKQKPVEWSEEDEKAIAHIVRILDDCYIYGRHDLSEIERENLIKTLKSLRPQPKVEWNKQDVDMINWLIRCCEKEHEELCNDKYGHQEIISDLKRDCRQKWNWLESLKNKVVPQPHWKPSEEQMEALRMALHINPASGKLHKLKENEVCILQSLLGELKKLM